MRTNTRWRWIAALMAVVLVGLLSRSGFANDDDDAQRLIEKIGDLLRGIKDRLGDADRNQSSNALDKLSDARDKAKDVLSYSNELKGKSVTESKRKLKETGDNYASWTSEFIESLRALDQMKRIEVQLKETNFPQMCKDVDGRLKDEMDRYVDQKDFQGAAKLADSAERQAQPVREKLRVFSDRSNDMSSWRDTARRFDRRDELWSDVRDRLKDTSQDTFDGWKTLLEQAQNECQRIVDWRNNNSRLNEGIKKLGENNQTRDAYYSDLVRKLQEATNLLLNVENKGNDSDVQSALNKADEIDNVMSRLKDARGTDPKANYIADKWPAYLGRFKDSCRLLSQMKQGEYRADHAAERCKAVEGELLQMIKDFMSRTPIDQDRQELRERAKAEAQKAGAAIASKLEQADRFRDELGNLRDKVRDFSPDDNDWRPLARALSDSAVGIYEHYKSALEGGHRVCDSVSQGDTHPAIKQALWGDCSESQQKSLQKTKSEKCDQKRTCKSLDDKSQCDEMKNRVAIGQACLEARKNIAYTCYQGGDRAHQDEMSNVEDVMKECQRRIDNYCR